ncbi:hypothetical protein BDF19DRAFT_446520 [Syncephalis fuscata]|nr:hypothetical protein BDF19DRAFT_446520 [Syncephalis fuscata]
MPLTETPTPSSQTQQTRYSTGQHPSTDQTSWSNVVRTFRQRPLLLLGLVVVPIGLYGGAMLHDWIKPKEKQGPVPKDASHASFLKAQTSASSETELYRVYQQRRRELMREKRTLEDKIAELSAKEQSEMADLNGQQPNNNSTGSTGTTTTNPPNA